MSNQRIPPQILQAAHDLLRPYIPELRDPQETLRRLLAEPAAVATCTPPPPRFITPDDAATIAGVHNRTVLGWIRSKRLPAKKLGSRTIRIAQADLLDFLGKLEAVK